MYGAGTWFDLLFSDVATHWDPWVVCFINADAWAPPSDSHLIDLGCGLNISVCDTRPPTHPHGVGQMCSKV